MNANETLKEQVKAFDVVAQTLKSYELTLILTNADKQEIENNRGVITYIEEQRDYLASYIEDENN